MVAKRPRHCVVRHDAEADFIGDEHNRPAKHRHRFDKSGALCLNVSSAIIRFVTHNVRQSTSTARSVRAFAQQGIAKRQGLLDRPPLRSAPVLVYGDAIFHLAIKGLPGGKVDWRKPAILDQLFGKGALARARATENQRCAPGKEWNVSDQAASPSN